MTIAQLEARLERRFLDILVGTPQFAGYRVRVSLFTKGRERVGDAGLENWSPGDTELRVTFEPVSGSVTSGHGTSDVGNPQPPDQEEAGLPSTDFKPVSIRGEPLSETVLRERR